VHGLRAEKLAPPLLEGDDDRSAFAAMNAILRCEAPIRRFRRAFSALIAIQAQRAQEAGIQPAAATHLLAQAVAPTLKRRRKKKSPSKPNLHNSRRPSRPPSPSRSRLPSSSESPSSAAGRG